MLRRAEKLRAAEQNESAAPDGLVLRSGHEIDSMIIISRLSRYGAPGVRKKQSDQPQRAQSSQRFKLMALSGIFEIPCLQAK